MADLLENKGLTWKSYQEDYVGECNKAARIRDKQKGQHYVRKHNPFISMTNIQNDPKRCANIVPLTQLDVDANKNALPNYMFVTPNMVCNNIH